MNLSAHRLRAQNDFNGRFRQAPNYGTRWLVATKRHSKNTRKKSSENRMLLVSDEAWNTSGTIHGPRPGSALCSTISRRGSASAEANSGCYTQPLRERAELTMNWPSHSAFRFPQLRRCGSRFIAG